MNATNCTGHCRFVSRRDLLRTLGGGLGYVALADLLAGSPCQAGPPLTPALSPEGRGRLAAGGDEKGHDAKSSSRAPHYRPTAKRVLMLFMSAGVSHVDSFDYKPALAKHAGQELTGRGNVKDVFFRQPGKLMPSFFPFRQHGQSGKWCSDLFPRMNEHVDELTFVHSMVAQQNSHGPAMCHFMTGEPRNGFPSLGSWAVYALGSETQNLPAFVVMMDRGMPPASTANWSNGFLPSRYQGTVFRSQGDPILDLRPPGSVSAESQRESFELLGRWNERHLKDHPEESDLAARIAAYELAARMQISAPEAADLARETAGTLRLYGVDRPDPQQATFSRMCLQARRLLERGVRFVTVFSGGSNNKQPSNWDAHEDLVGNHVPNAAMVDQPIAALLADLRQRGLLDDTLVIWTGEFGRTPTSEGAKGRDHNISGFTLWMAGGGLRPGLSYGATDEIGFAATEKPMPIADLHATILHALGLDHTRLTYYYNGLERRITGVTGNVVKELFA